MDQSTLTQRGEAATAGDTLTFRIGGIGIHLSWPGPGMAGPLQRFQKPFVKDGDETIRIRVLLGNCPEVPRGQPVFDAEGNWRLYRVGSRYLFEIFDPLTGACQTDALVTHDFREAEAYVAPPASPKATPAWSLPRLMQPLVQLLLINLLDEFGGAMVHALGVDDNGRGSVFVGPSGAGKTTLGLFWKPHPGVRILSDECVILRRIGDRLYAYGTPWSGELLKVTPHPGPVEVERVYFIEHHREHCLWPAPEAYLASQLCSQLFLPFWNRTAIAAALDFCRQVVLTLPCHRLGFAKHPSIVGFLRRHAPRSHDNKGGTR